MSANNWMMCPKCNVAEEKRQKAAKLHAGEHYGKVSKEAYLELLADAEPRELEDTLREDYEVGLSKDGKFFVSYSGYCEACEFHFKFKHEADAMKAGTP